MVTANRGPGNDDMVTANRGPGNGDMVTANRGPGNEDMGTHRGVKDLEMGVWLIS